MQFRKVDPYHAASLCGKYTIARFNAGPESTYMAFKGSLFIESHSFQVERDDDGVELPTYPARVDAFKLAMSACERDAEAVARE
jgi:hypothetical protein